MEELDSILAIQEKRLAKKCLDYPLLSPQEALHAIPNLGEIGNADEFALKEKSNNRLFVFSLRNDGSLFLPKFQFNAKNHTVLPIVPRLCFALSGLSDLSVYFWLTSYDDDLESTPADCLEDLSRSELVVDLASLYKNESTLRHLSH